MTEHDSDVRPVLGGYLVSGRSDPSAPYNSPSPANSATGYKFLSDYTGANIKPGDTVRVNGRVFPDVDDALRK